jgi:hypothetical protein
MVAYDIQGDEFHRRVGRRALRGKGVLDARRLPARTIPVMEVAGVILAETHQPGRAVQREPGLRGARGREAAFAILVIPE